MISLNMFVGSDVRKDLRRDIGPVIRLIIAIVNKQLGRLGNNDSIGQTAATTFTGKERIWQLGKKAGMMTQHTQIYADLLPVKRYRQ